MKITTQFVLTVNDGKWLIARAILEMENVKNALKNGKVVLKGGTTVSCISELLCGYRMKICGRTLPEGGFAGKRYTSQSHLIMIENGEVIDIDKVYIQELLKLNPGDVIITGANIIDAYGNAAMLAGSPGGNQGGQAAAPIISEGADVIVAAGLEKLMPGSVLDSMKTARRKGIEPRKGMSCGLFPVVGDIVTEVEAMKQLADVDVCIIGRGGIFGAEGGTFFQVTGEEEEVLRLEEIVKLCRNQRIGGCEISLE